MWNSAHEAYVESRVLSADRLELVRLLYEAAMSAVLDARRHLAEGAIAERSRAISKAWEILVELDRALDHTRGGEISTRLAALYEYMQRRLMEANFRQSDGPLVEVLGLLSTVAEGWEGIRAEPPVPRVHENPWGAPDESAAGYPSQAWTL